MKALVLTGPRKLTLETVPDPSPAPDEAVVEVTFAGICGTDVETFSHFSRKPMIPGHEWTGVVIATGRDVTNVKRGERVIAEVAIGCGKCRFCHAGKFNVCRARREVGLHGQDGGFAEFACIPSGNLRNADGLPADQAALTEPTAVSLNGCRRAQISPSDRVLVIGAGPIGLLSLQCAKACGAENVTVLDRNSERLELAKALGADRVLDGNELSPADLPTRANELTSGEGFDVILECAGATAYFEHLPAALAHLGRIAVVGCFEHAPKIHPNILIWGERSIVGAVGGGSSYVDAVDMLRTGKVKAPPLITHKVPLAEGPGVLASLADRKGPQGALKILFQP